MKKKNRSKKHAAWDAFSKFIRKVDADENGMVKCFSCRKVAHWKEMDAGHYIPKSISLALRFYVKNVNVQCTACNRFRHGNLTEYALALKKKYGDGILEELDEIRREGEGHRISESEYQELYDKYK